VPRPGRMAGRSCLIVGGTSGVGLATARRFLEEGAQVVVAGLETAGTRSGAGNCIPLDEALLAPLRSLGPCTGWSFDVGNASEVELLFAEALGFLGQRIDVLVHSAGQSGRRFGDGPLHECSLEAWGHVMHVNAFGVFATNRAAVRLMLRQPLDAAGLRGTVLNVGSVLDRSPSPVHFGTTAYAASKGAIRALTLASAAQYAAERIRFNLLVPGLIDTPMAARAANDPRIRSYLATKQPIVGGPGLAEDVAEAALYLCEPGSRFVTGAELTVDGGWCVSEGVLEGESASEPSISSDSERGTVTSQPLAKGGPGGVGGSS
jgi:NAD(P)-dependent dehydrogenase (short-subunit alcohol dehydrogenase family)